MRLQLPILLGVALAAVGSRAAAAAPLYEVLDLGGGVPVAIDDAGRVAGTRFFGSFLTQPGQPIRPEDLLPDNVRAVDMSPGGILVGKTISSSSIESPVVWNGTSWQAATTTPGEDWDDVSSVNDAGRVVGGGMFAYYLADPGVPTTTVPAPAGLFSMNPGPVVAPGGSVYATFYAFDPVSFSHVPHGFVWNGTTLTPFPELDAVHDVNTRGDVVGAEARAVDTNPSGPTPGDTELRYFAKAILGGSTHDLHLELISLGGDGATYSIATAINEAGEVVGTSGDLGAFHFANGELVLLQSQIAGDNPFSRLVSAIDINAAGQIVGVGELADGTKRAYLLTPIPEPATASLLLLGLAALRLRRRR